MGDGGVDKVIAHVNIYLPSHMRGRAVLNQWYGYIRVDC